MLTYDIYLAHLIGHNVVPGRHCAFCQPVRMTVEITHRKWPRYPAPDDPWALIESIRLAEPR
jgi:hypothetical protein